MIHFDIFLPMMKYERFSCGLKQVTYIKKFFRNYWRHGYLPDETILGETPRGPSSHSRTSGNSDRCQVFVVLHRLQRPHRLVEMMNAYGKTLFQKLGP